MEILTGRASNYKLCDVKFKESKSTTASRVKTSTRELAFYSGDLERSRISYPLSFFLSVDDRPSRVIFASRPYRSQEIDNSR